MRHETKCPDSQEIQNSCLGLHLPGLSGREIHMLWRTHGAPSGGNARAKQYPPEGQIFGDYLRAAPTVEARVFHSAFKGGSESINQLRGKVFEKLKFWT
jgi:hypothetical protein